MVDQIVGSVRRIAISPSRVPPADLPAYRTHRTQIAGEECRVIICGRIPRRNVVSGVFPPTGHQCVMERKLSDGTGQYGASLPYGSDCLFVPKCS
jgi:hypothetical protein